MGENNPNLLKIDLKQHNTEFTQIVLVKWLLAPEINCNDILYNFILLTLYNLHPKGQKQLYGIGLVRKVYKGFYIF